MVHKKLGRLPTTKEFDDYPKTACTSTIIIRFGTWKNFLKKAGFEVTFKRRPYKKVQDEDLFHQVRTLAKKLGRTPTKKEFDADPSTMSSSTTVIRFGTWKNFLKKAGFEVDCPEYTSEELISQVQMLAKELGRPPIKKEFNDDPRVVKVNIVEKRFGSWTNFLKVAKVESYRRSEHSSEELISQVQMLAKELGETPTMQEFNDDPRVVKVNVVKKRFGSWNEFLEKAGLEINRRRAVGVSREEMIGQVHMLARELKRTPTATEFDEDPRTVSFTAVKNRFGSWNALLDEAGLAQNRPTFRKIRYKGKTTDAEKITQLCMLKEKLGRLPTAKEFDESPETVSLSAVISHFGSWKKFVKAEENTI